MFAAGSRDHEQQPSARDGSEPEDWLSVGRSFAGVSASRQEPSVSTSPPSTALQKLSKRRRGDKKSSKKSRKSGGGSESDSSDAERRRRRRWRHKHERKPKRLRESDGRASASADRSLVAAAPAEVQAWINQQQADVALDGSKLFEFDCTGDRDNRFYGTLYAQDKPLYALATRRNLLTGAWIADAASSSARVGAAAAAAAKRDSEPMHVARYFGASARQEEKDARRTRLFLAYSDKRLARQREQRGSGAAAAAAAELAFIPVGPVLDGSADSEELVMRTETANVEQFLVTRSKAFNESLHRNPRDVALWFDYVAFQAQAARLTRHKISGRSEMVAEKQAAILDRAIRENPESRAFRLASLNLSMLRRRGDQQQQQKSGGHRSAHDIDVFRQQLEEMIESDPTNGELWGKLILARQQNFANFSVPSLRELYARVIGVLRKEVAKAVQQELRGPPSNSAGASGGSVQIFDANSLLASSSSAPPSYTSVLASSERANELVRLLLAYYSLACRLETATGYSERSIAHLQALLDFNVAVTRSVTSIETATPEQLHSEMLRVFASRWSELLPHFGDDFDASISLATAFVPPPDEFSKHVEARLLSSLTSMNPPESIRSPGHQQRLLQLAAGTLYKSRGGLDAINEHGAGEMASTDKREGSAADGLTYSNVHGYRIKIDEIDDASEYERILGELRGTESSIARQESELKRKEKQRANAAKSIARFHDERVDYDQVGMHDEFVEWLQREELKENTEWMPLRLNDPRHQELIAESPDRAVLTEEIQPFLFLVPRSLHLRIALNLLECVGMRWMQSCADHPEALKDVYADSFDEFDDLRGWESLDTVTKRFRKQPKKLRKHLESVLSSDVRAAVVEKYRVELEIAVQQESKRVNRGTEVDLRQGDWLGGVGYCAHNLCLAVYAVAGFHAARSEYQELVRGLCLSDTQIDRRQSRWLQLCYLEFIQQHQLECAFPIVAPREWRQAIGSAVERLPHDPVLLRLFVDAETGSTMSQRLRQHFHRAQQRWQRQFDSPLLVEWLFALLCEFGRLERFASHAVVAKSDGSHENCGLTPSLESQQQEQETCCLLHKYASNVVGLERVRRLLQDMVESVRTQGHALCWRLYVRFEERLGKVETARRVFYRGLAKCPWSKALYLDGIRVLRPYLNEDECKELVAFMSAKELHLRED